MPFFFRMRKMNLGAGANRLRGSVFALTVPDLDNANVGMLTKIDTIALKLLVSPAAAVENLIEEAPMGGSFFYLMFPKKEIDFYERTEKSVDHCRVR